jgi:hypothetical protein
VLHQPLINRKKIAFFPLLHIKLGKMENFVKIMNNDGNGFSYLKHTFPRISEVKIKGGIFINPQITKFMHLFIYKFKLN